MANVAFIGLGNMGGPMATNLVKAGHRGAMQHLGYRPDVPVTVSQFAVTPVVPRGQAAEITLTLSVPQDAPLVVDYIIDFIKADGATAPKVLMCPID